LLRSVALVLSAVLAGAANAAAGDVKTAGAAVSATVTVTAIDMAQRRVTVRNAEGVETSFTVDPTVQKLDQVKVGDRVQLDYTVAVAVTVRKGGEGIREKVESEAPVRQVSADKPGVTVGKRTTIVTNVLGVDRDKGTVRLQGPEGRVGDFEVEDKAALAEVKTGDQVVAVVYEAVAVGVHPADATAAPK
jgi:Cu/Ag efflux protein CusF